MLCTLIKIPMIGWLLLISESMHFSTKTSHILNCARCERTFAQQDDPQAPHQSGA